MSLAQKIKEVFIPPKPENTEEEEVKTENIVAQEPLEKKKPLTAIESARMYGRPSSFVQKLPWYEFQKDSKTVLLDDGKSVAAVFDVVPVATEEALA